MLKNVAPTPASHAIRKARRLRREMTLPEVLLWRELRLRPGNLKFRRQHAAGDFVLDFFCSDARLAIETDGVAHAMGNRPARDRARDAWFARTGIMTLRISACDALRDIAALVERIVDVAQGRLPLHHPAAPDGPPPRDKLGED